MVGRMSDPQPITIRPERDPLLEEAVAAGGGVLVKPAEAVGLVWTHPAQPDDLDAFLCEHPQIRWVQLPWAGIEPYLPVIRRHHDRTWSSAAGVYAEPVGEHALALLLAGFRNLHGYARAKTWSAEAGRNLLGARVVVIGGGGIARVFVDLLAPFGCHITVVRRHDRPFGGANRVLTLERLDEALNGADAAVLALPLVDDTRHVLGAHQLGLLAPGAWVINVARGGHVDTDALVAVLESGHLGGAALDVTEPEPLPDDHPLWSYPNVLITPHTASTKEMSKPLLALRITENVARYGAGESLAGAVDPELGY